MLAGREGAMESHVTYPETESPPCGRRPDVIAMPPVIADFGTSVYQLIDD